MKYLLDSNTLSDLYDKRSPNRHKILRRLSQLSVGDEVYISVLAYYEAGYALANAPEAVKPAIQEQIDEMREDFTAFPVFENAALVFGKLKKSLRDTRSMKPENMKKHNIDLMLAATAIVTGATMVSADGVFAELSRINPGLQVDDWTM